MAWVQAQGRSGGRRSTTQFVIQAKEEKERHQGINTKVEVWRRRQEVKKEMTQWEVLGEFQNKKGQHLIYICHLQTWLLTDPCSKMDCICELITAHNPATLMCLISNTNLILFCDIFQPRVNMEPVRILEFQKSKKQWRTGNQQMQQSTVICRSLSNDMKV